MVPPRTCDAEDPNFMAGFPTLKYTMSGVTVELTPEMYVVRTADNVCKPAYMQIDVPSEFGHAYIFGVTSFLRHFYTVFKRGLDGEPSMVGIAPAKHSREGLEYLTELITNTPGFGAEWLGQQTNTLDEEMAIDEAEINKGQAQQNSQAEMQQNAAPSAALPPQAQPAAQQAAGAPPASAVELKNLGVPDSHAAPFAPLHSFGNEHHMPHNGLEKLNRADPAMINSHSLGGVPGLAGQPAGQAAGQAGGGAAGRTLIEMNAVLRRGV
eukprot:Selendium_serpulae@DN6226_c3_g1_i12.p1